VVESYSCGSVSAAPATITTVPGGVTSTQYNISTNNQVVNINLATPSGSRIIFDLQGHIGVTINVLGGNVAHGIEFRDSLQAGPTQVLLVPSPGTQIGGIFLNSATGLTISGNLTLTEQCGSQISGTLTAGNLYFKDLTISDPTQTSDIQVQFDGNNYFKIENSQINVRSLLVAAVDNDASLLCSASSVVTTGTSTAFLGGYRWHSVSVGIATTAPANTLGHLHLNITGCSFSGPGRGFINYFSPTNLTTGNVLIQNSYFDFQNYIRVRTTGAGFQLQILNSVLNMSTNVNGAGLNVGASDVISTQTQIIVRNTLLYSANTMNLYGKNFTFDDSSAIAVALLRYNGDDIPNS